mmetsp:Transcript_4433/g.6565  ORF Transcript_4433/g.6565 Transcript_4433/m.6565 type:complete len:129 (-) Transcript_4433:1394-1780(-)
MRSYVGRTELGQVVGFYSWSEKSNGGGSSGQLLSDSYYSHLCWLYADRRRPPHRSLIWNIWPGRSSSAGMSRGSGGMSASELQNMSPSGGSGGLGGMEGRVSADVVATGSFGMRLFGGGDGLVCSIGR